LRSLKRLGAVEEIEEKVEEEGEGWVKN